jgi:very-short-patch-repair endonuclease
MDVDLRSRVSTAVARLDGEPAASHQTAAHLWGIPILGRPDQRVHLTRTRRHQGTMRDYPDLVVHHAALPADHRTHLTQVPVTTAARTVVDLARSGPFRAGLVVADGALHLRLCDRDSLTTTIEDCTGWPGVRRARAVAEFADSASASPLESISRAAFAQYGLPKPQLQAPITPYDFADFLWAAYRVIGEADGLSKYVTPEVLHNEKLRQERFAQMGYEVVRWTWREVFLRPDTVAFRVLDVLRRCGYPK